ncbi:unnamed protein product [Diamesa hyperborea]
MPMKDFLYRLQPVQLYVILVLSVVFFIVQLTSYQFSDSITLLVAAYHMLCNIIALSGCIITIKQDDQSARRMTNTPSETNLEAITLDRIQKEINEKALNDKKKNEKSLKNTFGWARVDVLNMLVVGIFMGSLCLSVVIEVIQTLFHHEHEHTMHQSPYVFILGVMGLVLNGLSYLLIGGYTFHQGSFLHLTPQGNVYILDRVVTDDCGRKVSGSKTNQSRNPRKHQNVHQMFRDICSSICVLICSALVYQTDNKVVDPVMSIISCVVLMIFSYPYMKQACFILLQTIPDTIDIQEFQKNILEKFTDIISIHDLHIWQLTAEKYVSTVHIIFQNPMVYTCVIEEVLKYFHDQGINIVTIQPEFADTKNYLGSTSNAIEEAQPLIDDCLVTCKEKACDDKVCCRKTSDSDSTKSLERAKSEIQLEQVVSIRNISDEDLNEVVLKSSTLGNSYSSVKSLTLSSDYTDVPEHVDTGKIRSSASLYIPSTVGRKRLQKALSAIDREHQGIPAVGSDHDTDESRLINVKKFVSESMIQSNNDTEEHRKMNQQIVVENKMLRQLDKTDNNEMEDIIGKCDAEDKET